MSEPTKSQCFPTCDGCPECDLTLGALEQLLQVIVHARQKHPKGANFEALVAELGEVAEARKRGDQANERDELLDVATVAIRLWMGEVSA